MHKLSAIDLRRLFFHGKISAEEITRFYLCRIERFDPTLKALLVTFKKKAIKKAQLLDKKRKNKEPLGRMAAVPIIIKDNIHIKGEITSCSSKFLKNYRALFNATVIDLLEREDAIFLGKSNLDEFAMGSSTEYSSFFSTKNPWDLSRVPGGSSGGSSASVAARLAPIALGTDTGGSIRQPAAFCGIVGFKPTYGRVSRYGLIAFGSSLDQIGPMATSVADAGLAMEVIGKHCENDSTSLSLPGETYTEDLPISLKGISVGVPWHFLENIQEETKKNFSKAIEKLKALGANICEINLDVLKHSIAIYYVLATAEASTNLARFDGIRYGIRSKEAKTLDEVYDISRDEGFGPEVKNRIMLGTYVLSAGYQEAYYKKAQKVRMLVIQAYEKAFTTCDVVAMPVIPSPAFVAGKIQDPIEMYMQDLFTISANLAGLPAISIPSGFNTKNLPFGLQLIGPQMHDTQIIRYAHAYEQATLFAKKIPPIFDKEAT